MIDLKLNRKVTIDCSEFPSDIIIGTELINQILRAAQNLFENRFYEKGQEREEDGLIIKTININLTKDTAKAKAYLEIYSEKILNLLKLNKSIGRLVFDSNGDDEPYWFGTHKILVKEKIGKAYSNYLKIYIDLYPDDDVTIELINF